MKFTTALHPDKPVMHIPFINYADFQLEEEESSFIALAEYKDGSKNLIHLVVQDGNKGLELVHYDLGGSRKDFDKLGITKILKICDLLEINDNDLLPVNINPADSDSEWLDAKQFRTGDNPDLGWAWVLMGVDVHDFHDNDFGKLSDAGPSGEIKYAVRLAEVHCYKHDEQEVYGFFLNISQSDVVEITDYEEFDNDHVERLGSIVAFKFIDPNLL